MIHEKNGRGIICRFFGAVEHIPCYFGLSNGFGLASAAVSRLSAMVSERPSHFLVDDLVDN